MKKTQRYFIGTLTAGTAAAVILVLASKVVAGPPQPDLALISGVMQLVQQDYVHPVQSQELTEDALKGMLTRLDPHSAYMNEREYRESMQDMSGKFGGVGLEISEHGGLPTVISPIDGTPAAESGLQPGDIITSVDGQTTQGTDLMKVVAAIRGTPGTTVKLTIVRGTKAPFDVPLTRKIIEVHSVKSKLEPDNIGYVRISQFGETTPDEFKHAITSLEHDAGGKLRGLVLDLRNDPGGLLSSAVDVSGDFLDGGTVVSIRGRRQGDRQVYSAPAHGNMLPGTPMVVLVNSASASASEIVAGAMQDRHRATVMGTQSFGKGSVQSVITLSGHGALRLTTALYYTPSGRSIQDEGISPDVVVQAPKDQQVESSLIWRESQLHGAFANPGTLGKPNGTTGAKAAADKTYSPPIKEQLIGTKDDAQLAAALDFLKKPPGSSSANGGSSGPI